jgi:hypothetical protein
LNLSFDNLHKAQTINNQQSILLHFCLTTTKPNSEESNHSIFKTFKQLTITHLSNHPHIPSHIYNIPTTPITAATAIPPETTFAPAPVNVDAVGVAPPDVLLPALPVASGLLVGLGTYLLWVAATLATDAADALAAGRRGFAALQ